jgi:hypothetical protein
MLESEITNPVRVDPRVRSLGERAASADSQRPATRRRVERICPPVEAGSDAEGAKTPLPADVDRMEGGRSTHLAVRRLPRQRTCYAAARMRSTWRLSSTHS